MPWVAARAIAWTGWSAPLPPLPVVRGQVRPEDVVTEVSLWVTPYRVGVVRVALRVVVLDEQPGTLEPVVERLTRIGGPGPRQVDPVEHGVAGVAHLRWQPVGHPFQIGGQERAEQITLAGVEVPARQALGVGCQREPAVVAGVIAIGPLGVGVRP